MSDKKDKKSKKQKFKDKIFSKSQEVLGEAGSLIGVDTGPTNRKTLIDRHKQLNGDISRLKEELRLIQTSLYELADEYDTSKGDCACCRYTDLKTSVQTCILKYSGASVSGDPTGVTGSFSSTSSDESRPLLGGSTNRLLLSCQRLAKTQHMVTQMEKKYSEMSEEDLRNGIVFLTKEEATLQVRYDTEKNKLNRLASQYRRLQDQCCLKRYSYLKKIIREAIVDYHDEVGPSVNI